MEVNLGFVLFAILMAYLVVVRPILGLLRDRKASIASGEQAAKAEALFRSAFPELQPHFHPASVASPPAREARMDPAWPPAPSVSRPTA